ncbi:MAG: hypothetical protein N3D11_01780 [Candidatus Sumerlaeia bacterium]|nr:hypothetical protein [Candidatus Sumerlaeia bacterium]
MHNYKSIGGDAHWLAEEEQWARILASGDAAAGMVLVFLQKMCTAFHEFEPACKAGALDESNTEFFRQRLAGRVRWVIRGMEANALESVEGFAQLQHLLERVEAAPTTAALAALTDEVHQLGHLLCDALLRRCEKRT